MIATTLHPHLAQNLAPNVRMNELRTLATGLRRLRAHGVDVSVRGRPGGAASGDHVTIVDLGDRRALVVVVDAHGPGAAARELAGVLAAHVRAGATKAPDLGSLLASAEAVVRRSGRGAVASMLLMLVDASRHTVRVANAGMPLPLVGGRAGVCVPLGERGPALGLAEGVRRRELGPIRLSPGQVLVAGTDGVFEAARTDGTTFGPDRVADAVAQRRADGPGAAAREVIARVERWSSPEDADDRTVLAVRLR